MNDSIGLYLNDIGKVSLLNAEEERELSRVIEAGREAAERLANKEKGAALKASVAKAAEAKDRFIRANLRLVVSIARRYPLPQGMDLLDLIQEGNLGLEHAVDKFDWRRGFKFSTYATFWIRQAIGRALDQKASLIRIPGDRSASLRAALRQASGDGETLDVGNAELHRLTTPVSLDKTIGDDGDATLGDLMANGDGTPEDAVMALVDGELLDAEDDPQAVEASTTEGLDEAVLVALRGPTFDVFDRTHVGSGRPQRCVTVRQTIDLRLDLLLHGAVAGPSSGHDQSSLHVAPARIRERGREEKTTTSAAGFVPVADVGQPHPAGLSIQYREPTLAPAK